MLLEQLYGDEERACKNHDNSDPYIYSYLVKEDKLGAFVELQIKTSFLMGGSTPAFLTSLTVYNTTNKIHVQGTSDNVKTYIQSFLGTMMEITRSAQISGI